VGLGSECAAGDFVVFVYRHCVCVCVGQFGVGLGSECAAGGFVVFVYRHCVCVCVCGTVCCGFGGVSVQQVALWCLYIGIVWL